MAHNRTWAELSNDPQLRCQERVPVRQLPMRVNINVRETPRPGGRRVPARREAVLESNGVFSFLLNREAGGFGNACTARGDPTSPARTQNRTVHDGYVGQAARPPCQEPYRSRII